MSDILAFGEEKPSLHECEIGDWVGSSETGPAENMMFRNPIFKLPAVWEFTVALHSDSGGDRWVWKRVA